MSRHLSPFINPVTDVVLAHQDLQVVGGGLHLSRSFKEAVSGGDDISLVDDGAATHEVTSLKLEQILDPFIESSKVDHLEQDLVGQLVLGADLLAGNNSW